MFPFILNLNIFGYPMKIGAYDLFFLLAAAVALAGGTIWSVKRGFKPGKTFTVLAVMAVGAVIGARLMNFLVSAGVYLAAPGRLTAFSAEGFSLYGGIIAAAAAGYFTCRLLKMDPFKLGDTLTPWLGICIAVMRIGCFLEGCCFGKVTDLPWGVRFPLLSPAHLRQIGTYGNFFNVLPVHPTQLYELAAALVLSMAAFGLLKRKRPGSAGKARNGAVLIFFLTGFSLFRLFNFFLREAPDGAGPLYDYYPFLYLALFLCGTVVLFLFRRKKDSLKIPATAAA